MITSVKTKYVNVRVLIDFELDMWNALPQSVKLKTLEKSLNIGRTYIYSSGNLDLDIDDLVLVPWGSHEFVGIVKSFDDETPRSDMNCKNVLKKLEL